MAPRSVAVIDAKQNSVVGDVALSYAPVSIAAGEGGVWAMSRDEKTLTHVDPRSREVANTNGIVGVPSDVAAGAGAVSVIHSSSAQQTTPGTADARVTRIDPESYLTETFDPQVSFDDVTYEDPIAAGDGVWVSSARPAGSADRPGTRGVAVRMDSSPPHGLRRLSLVRPAWGVASEPGSVWAASEAGLTRLSPPSNPLLPVEGTASVGPEGRTFPDVVAIGDGRVWGLGSVSGDCPGPTCNRSTLWTVDPGTNAVRSRTLSPGAGEVGAGAGAVWVTVPGEEAVWKIDPDSLQVLAKVDLGATPIDLAVLGNQVWVGIGD